MPGWLVDFWAALWIVGRILPSVQVCSEPSFWLRRTYSFQGPIIRCMMVIGEHPLSFIIIYIYHCVSYPKNIWKVCIGKLPLLFNMLHPIPRSSASNGGWVTTRLTRQRGTMHMEIPRPSKRLTKASWLGGNPRLPKWSRHNIMLISPGKNDTREQNNWGALRLSTCIFEGSCATACVTLGSLGLKTT